MGLSGPPKALGAPKNRVMDVFSECSRLAPVWFAAWRRLRRTPAAASAAQRERLATLWV
jgi:hypothetical protein